MDEAKSDAEEMVEKVEEKVEKKGESFRWNQPAPGPARKIEIGKANEFELTNGLKVIVVENNKLPRVSFSLSAETGPIFEGDKAGTLDMTGQLVNSGTTTKSKAEIDEEVDFIGANFSARGTGMFGSSLKKHSTELLAIMSDVLMNPSFPQEEFDKIKKQTLSGLAQDKEDPNSIARNVTSVLTFGKDHPYGELTTEETVENISVADCKKAYETYMKPNISYLTIVGDINLADAKMLAEKYFGSWKKGDYSKKTFEDPKAPNGTEIDFVNKTGAVQSVINVSYPVKLIPGSEDAIKASMMNMMFGGFFASRLNSNLREDKAYTYGIRSSLRPNKEIGSFNISGAVRNEVTDSSLTEIFKEMNTMINKPISAKELTLVKNVMSGNFARSLEQPQTVARFASNIARLNLPADYYETYLEKLNNVTAADIQAMAKKYLRPENAHFIIVGNKDEVADNLAKFASSKKVDFYDTYGNFLEIKDSPKVAGDVTASSVVMDFIKVSGGKEALMGLKTMTSKMSMSAMGANLEMTTTKKAPNFFHMIMIMPAQGMTIVEQKFNGVKGAASGMQGSQEFTEGDEFDAMAEQAAIFPELAYLGDDYNLELKGIENVDGVDCYKVIVNPPNGSKSTDYYEVESKLKKQTITTQAGQGGQEAVVTVKFSDYKAAEEFVFPHTIEFIGMGPAPMKSTVESYEFNKDVDMSLFRIE